MPRAASLAVLTALTAPVGAWAHAAATEDRYGPPAPAAEAVSSTGPAASGWLNWSNKNPTPASVQPARAAPRAMIEAEPAPAPRAERIAALPTSLYGAYHSLNGRAAFAPPEPPAPSRWTASGRVETTPAPAAPVGHAPRFYSVHREFGLTPDPVPLPQQFFADSAADLAAPPPPLAPHPVPGTQAATSPANTAANRARTVALETADSAAN